MPSIGTKPGGRVSASVTRTLLGLCLLSGAGALPAAPGLNVREDGGAAAYSEGEHADVALVSPGLAQRFPVAQRARIHVLGGGVRGFGMLAEYGPDGPGEIVVARVTKKPATEPYTPVALARVFDPDGKLVAVEEFSDQAAETEVRILKIATRKAGVWRVSFSGGRAGDRVEIRWPRTDAWGVRGEMALGVGRDLPRPAYLWVPPTSRRLLVGIETGRTDGIELRDATGKTALARVERDPTKRAGRLLLSEPPADDVVRLELPASFDGALVVEGAPGLWCPSEDAARRLRGGVVESHGQLTAGPLQARARDWMVATAATLDREPRFVFPKDVSDDRIRPDIDGLMFGRYGFANALGALVRTQNARLDPADPFFGTFREPGWKKGELNWTHFWSTPASANFQPAALAGAAAFESPLNPAYRHPEIVRRAALGALANIMSLQGDDLLREGNLERTRYPMTHAFFIYPPALAQAFRDLSGQLDPAVREIWREALIAVGDKIADFQAYQSNQWSHMLLGHLETYLATGERRFLRYFERQAAAFFDNAFGPASKFGQHPAGFYLEQNGPDGNYDRLNSYCLNAAWLYYHELPEADPALVEKMRAGIEKNLRFASLFWLPTPDGRLTSPTAFNTRTTATLAGAAYPGSLMTKSEFPLGLARFRLTSAPATATDIGRAWDMAFIANTPEWQTAVVREGLRRGPDGVSSPNGAWVSHVRHAYSRPVRVEAATPPVHDVGGTWELPGVVAWNRGGLYGVVFADVVGAKSTLNGFHGGGPMSLWAPETGPFVLSRSPTKTSRISGPQTPRSADSLTFSCVFGETDDGAFFHSGKERAELRKVGEARHEIVAKLDKPFARLVWAYDLREDDFTISAALQARPSARQAWVNLPLVAGDAVRLRLESPHSLVIEGPDGAAILEWDQNAPGELHASVHADLRRLVIPLPSDGSPLSIRVRRLRR